MKKKLIITLILLLLITTMLAGCSFLSSFSGNDSLDEVSEYLGWWVYINQTEDGDENKPFAYFEVSKNNIGEIYCYDNDGQQIDSGSLNISRSNELMKQGAYVVLSFDTLGDFGVFSRYDQDNTVRVELGDGNNVYDYYHIGDQPTSFGASIRETYEYYPVGYWISDGTIELPFYSIDASGSTLIACDEDGWAIDHGYLEYDKLRELSGGPLVVLAFEEIGVFAADYKGTSGVEGEFQMNISNLNDWSDNEKAGKLDYFSYNPNYYVWWTVAYPETQDFLPFINVALKYDTNEVYCFDEDLNFVDKGTFEMEDDLDFYDGGTFAFSFDNIGTATMTGYESDLYGGQYIQIIVDEILGYDNSMITWSLTFFLNQTPQKVDTRSFLPDVSIDLSDFLLDFLAEEAEGKTLVLHDEKEDVDGIMCDSFSLGTNTPEKFFAERHFAVSPKGHIFEFDVIASEWIELEN